MLKVYTNLTAAQHVNFKEMQGKYDRVHRKCFLAMDSFMQDQYIRFNENVSFQ